MHEYMMPMLECPACHGKLDWTIEERNVDHIERAEPTPGSKLIEGVRLDALPVVETELTWCTLIAQ